MGQIVLFPLCQQVCAMTLQTCAGYKKNASPDYTIAQLKYNHILLRLACVMLLLVRKLLLHATFRPRVMRASAAASPS